MATKTREEFVAYVESMGMSAEKIEAAGLEIVQCSHETCGYDGCEGWRLAHKPGVDVLVAAAKLVEFMRNQRGRS